MEEIGNGFRGLDPEASRDLTDTWLISVLGQKVDHVVVNALLELREWLRHTPKASGRPRFEKGRRALSEPGDS
jgi:hypothetical protein